VAKAITSFEQALELEPGHEKATEMLQGPRLITQNGGTSFSLDGYEDSQFVTLAGTFNQWNSTNIPMKKSATGWHVNVALPQGEYFYKFVVDGKWIFDPGNAQTGMLGGRLNSAIIVDSP
jgi:1,4-alpha-glucan branching enzyme